jgi:hypothetical protein
MANRAYASVWCAHLDAGALAPTFQKLLATVPFSAAQPGFVELTVRAVDASHSPVLEIDLRSQPADAAQLMAMAQEHLQADTALETAAHWDLWVFDLAAQKWQQLHQRLEIICSGEEYDDAAFAQNGHLRADVGFEHFFTGHAGLLASRGGEPDAPQHPVEASFLAAMSQPGRLQEYRQHTKENVRKLHDWLRSMERAVPLARHLLWSEGEENFEARLDEIFAMR